MSYCRFSTDQFRCDVYVYEHCGGWWQIHVAGNKLVSDEPRPADVAPDWWSRGADGVAEHMAADEALTAWMDRATRVAINLPHAGEGFECTSPDECADTLVMLKELGYVVPQFAIDALRDEAKETQADAKEVSGSDVNEGATSFTESARASTESPSVSADGAGSRAAG